MIFGVDPHDGSGLTRLVETCVRLRDGKRTRTVSRVTLFEVAARLRSYDSVSISSDGHSLLSQCRSRHLSDNDAFELHFELFDRDDLPFPPWIALEILGAIWSADAAARRQRRWKRAGWTRPPMECFRSGPIPVSDFRSYREHLRKRSGTFAETRTRMCHELDLRLDRWPVRMRGRRSAAAIGDNDIEGRRSFRNQDRCWKRHRRTQWKE